MKKTSIFLCGLLLLFSLTACSNSKEHGPYSSDNSSLVSENSSASAAQSSGTSEGTGSGNSTESSTSAAQSSGTSEGTGSGNSTESSTSAAQSYGTSTEKPLEPPTHSGTISDTGTESSTSATQSYGTSEETGSDTSTESSTSTTQSTETSDTKSDPVQTQSTHIDTPSKPDENSQSETNNGKENSEYMMNIKIGDRLLTATLERNSSAKALIELLSDRPVTVHMSDYAGMEKVGTLPVSLPRNDEHIDTDACDLILYQGNQFVIYYDTNSWSLTRLGKINNITKSELKNILGTGDVTAVLSLP